MKNRYPDMGDLQSPLNIEHGQPEQEMPIGMRLPSDIEGQYRAGQKANGTPVGDPKKNAYTVSVFDARPPNGFDVTLDGLFNVEPPP